jgi:aarF domain-containing kinase
MERCSLRTSSVFLCATQRTLTLAFALSALQSVREMSRQMKDVRSQMEENEQLRVLMSSLRGSNLSDADFADDSVQMQLVEVRDGGADGDSLPLEYDPELISDYWGRRPVSVMTRILQLLCE